MPRDANGTYTLPAGNPVVSGTIITAAWANTTMPDIGQALTDSLDRYGRGGMLAPFKFNDGAVSAPGAAWTNEPSTGFYRAGAGDLRVSLLGSDLMRWNAGNVQIWKSSAWQNVLYTGSAGTVPSTATTDDSLRWSGTTWVSNANVTMTAAGALKITGALTGVTSLTMAGALTGHP